MPFEAQICSTTSDSKRTGMINHASIGSEQARWKKYKQSIVAEYECMTYKLMNICYNNNYST